MEPAELVEHEANSPVDNPAVAPDIVVQSDIAEPTDFAGPTEIVEVPEWDPIAAMNDQAADVSEHCTMYRLRMANHPGLPGHHRSILPLQDLPAD